MAQSSCTLCCLKCYWLKLCRALYILPPGCCAKHIPTKTTFNTPSQVFNIIPVFHAMGPSFQIMKNPGLRGIQTLNLYIIVLHKWLGNPCGRLLAWLGWLISVESQTATYVAWGCNQGTETTRRVHWLGSLSSFNAYNRNLTGHHNSPSKQCNLRGASNRVYVCQPLQGPPGIFPSISTTLRLRILTVPPFGFRWLIVKCNAWPTYTCLGPYDCSISYMNVDYTAIWA